MERRLITLFFYLLFSPWLWANQCASGFAPKFQHLSLEHGLSQSVVTAISEDASGYIWLGTQEGLNRYDGFAFDTWSRSNEPGKLLPDNHVTALASAPDGTLWIGTTRGLAFKRADSEFIQLAPIPENLSHSYVLSLLVDGSGRVWVGTTLGLFVFDPIISSTKVWVGEGGKRLGDSHARALFLDSREHLWLGTANGLYRINLANESWDESRYLNGVNVTDIIETKSRTMVVGARQGVYIADNHEKIDFKISDLAIPGNEVQALAEDGDGRLWIATDNGVLVSTNSDTCVLEREAVDSFSLSSSDVMSMHVGQHGVIWLGTFAGGVNFWDTDNARFQHHLIPWRVSNKIKSNTVLAVLRDHRQQLWFGLAGDGLVRKEGRETNKVQLNNTTSAQNALTVQALLEDKLNRLWVSTFGEGLIRLSADRKVEQRWLPDAQNINSISSRYVRTIYEDHSGQLWIGTEAGLDKVIEIGRGPDNVSFERFGPQLPVEYQARSSEVATIVEDYLGQLWVGGPGGLILLDADREKMRLFRHEPGNANSLSHTSITTLRLAGNGDLWVGTAEGFNRIRRTATGEYQIIRDNVLTHNSFGVFGILPGVDGDIWISTGTGLLRYNPEREYTVLYRHSNGLPSDEFNLGAAFLGADGELLFGTINGAVSFYPQSIKQIRKDAAVVLVGYREYDKTVPMLKGLDGKYSKVVDADTRVMSFDYSVLDFSDPQRNRLRYKLRGLHDTWINLVRSRTVTLSGLEAGKYVLEVQGAPAKGVWSSKTHEIELTVRSPFWSVHMTYGVLLISLLVLSVVTIFLLWRHQHRIVRKQSEQIIKLSAEASTYGAKSAELQRNYLQQSDILLAQESQLISIQQRLLDAQHQDALTGVPSRRFILPLITELAIAPKPRCMVLVDIDALSVLNEQYGYIAGDRILMQFSQLLLTICREDDRVLRWDGGTFLLVCNVNSVKEITSLCERIKARVLQHAFMISERKHADLTCSIGFSSWPLCLSSTEISDWQSAINIADEALFLSKHYGRNCWFGFYMNEDCDLSQKRALNRQSVKEAMEQQVLSMASSLTISAQFIEQWPKR